MSNTNNTMQTQTSNALHNAIMEVGGKDRPPITIPVAEGIDNDIYSTVDACPNAMEIWKAIERLKQGESINVQDLETNLYWEFGKFTSRDGESLESYYSWVITRLLMNEPLSEFSVEFTILNLIPLTTLKIPQPDHNKLLLETEVKQLSTLFHPLMIKNLIWLSKMMDCQKEKAFDKLMALISLSFKKIYKPTNNNLRTSSNTSRANQDNNPRTNRGPGYDNQRAVNVAGARETVGTQVVQQSGIQCYNFKEFRHVARVCQKLKQAKDAACYKEKMILYKHEEAVIQQHPEQPESVNDTYLNEQGDTNITTDLVDMSTNEEEVDQDDDGLARERYLLASLIGKLKCEIDDKKNCNKLWNH
ncbi:hypothetical protein Tco_0964221 [Tanacetum coccineum]